MFCPKCGQPQASDEVRFCVRCGFLLDNVKNLITTEGLLIQQGESNKAVSKWNKPGVKTGAKLIFLSLILTPIFLSLVLLDDELFGFILVPKTIFLIGLFWMLYARIFGESPVNTNKTTAPSIKGANAENFLPQHETPSSLPPQSINTAEMIRPTSVTENTTKLFEQK